jgi:hypothetical protein
MVSVKFVREEEDIGGGCVSIVNCAGKTDEGWHKRNVTDRSKITFHSDRLKLSKPYSKVGPWGNLLQDSLFYIATMSLR